MATEIYLGNPPSNIIEWMRRRVMTFVTYTEESKLPDWSGEIDSVNQIPHPSDAVTVRLGKKITSIDNTFKDNTNLESIVIPNTVTNIWDNVFSSCSRLTRVEIPNSVTNIGSSAFS